LKSLNFYIIAIIFVLGFCKGVLILIGVFEPAIQLIIDILIIILFFNSMLYVFKHKKIIVVGFTVNIFLFIVIITSFLLTDVNDIQLLIFIRKFAIYYLFFYALFNINLDPIYKDKLLKLLMFLFVIQIPAAFIKLGVLGGTMEDYIGTMSIQEGSLATIMPLMAISFLITNYLEFKKVKYIIFILLFIAIGLISDKMGLLFYIILLFMVLTYIFSKRYSDFLQINMTLIRNILINTFFLIIIFAAFVSLNPRANPEHQIGGSIDIEYLIEFIADYQTLHEKGSTIEGEGRFEAPVVALEKMRRGGYINVLFGFGPGEIVKSSFTPYVKPLLEKYNIGYGGRIGLVWMGMQIGLVGMVVFLLFHLLLLKKLLQVYNSESTNEKLGILTLTAIGFSVIYFLDFFTYSTEMIQNPGMATSYFFVIYYVLDEYNSEETA
jgi:hypothetical protein